MKRGPNNQPVGEDHHMARLTERKVLWLRKMQDRGLCLRCCAAILKVPYPTAWDATNYRTWKHVR